MIEFRGMHKQTGKWLFGSLINNAFYASQTGEPVTCIFDPNSVDYEYDCDVDVVNILGDSECEPKTIGQFTGLKDKSNMKAYDGDICELDGMTMFIKWSDGAFNLVPPDNNQGRSVINQDRLKRFTIVGNIHENKELLEVG